LVLLCFALLFCFFVVLCGWVSFGYAHKYGMRRGRRGRVGGGGEFNMILEAATFPDKLGQGGKKSRAEQQSRAAEQSSRAEQNKREQTINWSVPLNLGVTHQTHSDHIK
jgi:hypothetical protein